MSEYTKESIKEIVSNEKIGFIRIMFSDIFGFVKNVEITNAQLDKLLENNLMFDGSSIDGFVRIEESDMYLYPDLSTFKVLPDALTDDAGKTAMVIADIYTSDRKPFDGDPRYRLANEISEMKKAGFDSFNIGTEPEFFLFKLDAEGNITNKLNDEGGYFDLAPLDLGEKTRREIILTLEKMGFEIEAAHHEVAPGQHEVDFKYEDALKAADNIQLFKLIVKTIARKNGYYATFMPKPVSGINGNGMHTNMSLSAEGKNVFLDSDDTNGLSKIAYSFLAGLLEHATNFTAVTNPTVNSYKRLIPGFEAPVYVAWSSSNRSPMIRIPASRGQSTRLELRMVDPTTNPYLAFSAILASGLDGIKNKMEPTKAVDENIYLMSLSEREEKGIRDLPSDLSSAIENLKSDDVVVKALGSKVAETFIEAKEQEFASYRKSVSEWEIDRYLDFY